MRRRRALTANEQDLWSLVVRSVRPLRLPARKAAKSAAKAAAKAAAKSAAETAADTSTGEPAAGAVKPANGCPARVSGKAAAKAPAKTATKTAAKPATKPATKAVLKAPAKAVATAAPPPPKPAPRPHGPPALQPIMRREIKKLARGGETIDARIDLHGMTQSEAHAALQSLLLRCQANGDKFVLVITGKGRSSGERGVLRRQVPVWLGLPEFRRLVAGYEVAHAGHGGEGALYVRVRKPRAW